MIKASKKKPARTSSEPKPLTTNWLDDDFYESSTKEFSYVPGMTRYYVIHNKTGEFLRTYKGNKKAQAEQYACGRNCWVLEFIPTEEQAHEMRLAELANLRWEGGYGA